MNHKVFRSVFVVAVALGIVSAMVRIKDDPAVGPQKRAAAPADKLSRPLASYRVYEEKIQDGIDFRGAGYKARVAESGCVFGAVPELGSVWAAREFTVEFGAPRIEQGAVRLECAQGRFVRPAFGVGQIDRGAVVEEYLFENHRIEQIFRFPAAVGEGALRLSIPVKTDLDGPVVAHAPHADAFVEPMFVKGGLAFCDASGATRMGYHSALAIDAAGREIALAPRMEGGAIILDIPADYMAKAAYPLVIDPWLDLAGSGTGGGVSANGSHSEKPTIALAAGGQPFICWADNSAAGSTTPNNTDIYLKWWNGFEFFALAESASPGGISKSSGKSSNPTLSLGASQFQSPIVAWEDDTSGSVSIFVKKWPAFGEPGTGWTELAGSASGNGVSKQFSPALHPSVGGIVSRIPGITTFDVNGNVISSTPDTFFHSPVVAYDLPVTGGGTQIVCLVFYPGAPAQPKGPIFINGTQAVPGGWYTYGDPGFVSTTFFSTMTSTPAGFVSQYPSLVTDSANRVSIAWQDTSSNNYEIYFRTFQYSGGGGPFQVVADPANPLNGGFLEVPAGAFAGIGGSDAAGGVSATPGLSQFPSLSQDSIGGTQNFTIGWQDSETAVATTSQIYVARSVAGASFAGIGGSAGLGGVSQTLNHAGTPSLDVNGNYIGVAWTDDSNSRSSIYVRRMFLGVGGSGLWEQVGFQGSAFPAILPEVTAPIAGVSQSGSYALQPSLKLDEFGSPFVAWADGSAATFDIRLRIFSPNGPGIATGVGTNSTAFSTNLRQTLTDPRPAGVATDIPTAGFATGTQIFLSSRVFTEDLNPATIHLEFEVQPQGAPFTNSPSPIPQADPVIPDSPAAPTLGNIAVLKFDGLPNTNYHWQARAVDQIGRSSPWIQFATDAAGVSFRINASAPPGGGGGNGPVNSGTTGANTTNKSKCGLTGLEAIALLGALRLLRRRRSK